MNFNKRHPLNLHEAMDIIDAAISPVHRRDVDCRAMDGERGCPRDIEVGASTLRYVNGTVTIEGPDSDVDFWLSFT